MRPRMASEWPVVPMTSAALAASAASSNSGVKEWVVKSITVSTPARAGASGSPASWVAATATPASRAALAITAWPMRPDFPVTRRRSVLDMRHLTP